MGTRYSRTVDLRSHIFGQLRQGPVQITRIDGLNTTNITNIRGTKLDIAYTNLHAALYAETRIPSKQLNAMIRTYAALQYLREVYDYNFRQEVAAGGAFFNHEINTKVTSNFVGVKLGAEVIKQIAKRWGAKAGVFVMPGHRWVNYKVRQPGGAFGATGVVA